MVEGLILAIVIAKIKGYKLSIALKKWQFYPLFVACSVIVILYIATLIFGQYQLIQYTGMVKVLMEISILSLWWLLIKNKAQTWIYAITPLCIFAGSKLNKIVMAANGGKMPIFQSTSKLFGIDATQGFRFNDVHMLGSANTKMWYLSDIFDLVYENYSIGDIVAITLPIAFMAYIAIKSINHK